MITLHRFSTNAEIWYNANNIVRVDPTSNGSNVTDVTNMTIEVDSTPLDINNKIKFEQTSTIDNLARTINEL